MKQIILMLGIVGIINVPGYCQTNKNDDKKKKNTKIEKAPTEKRICIYTRLPLLPQTVLMKDITLNDLQPQIEPIYKCGNVNDYDGINKKDQ